jgi:hypothetical protein
MVPGTSLVQSAKSARAGKSGLGKRRFQPAEKPGHYVKTAWVNSRLVSTGM